MNRIFSNYFGAFDPRNREVVHFRNGLPGFEDLTHFAAIAIPGQEPILYLQSTGRPDVCLITVPARIFVPDYEVDLTPEDRESLALSEQVELRIGSTIACQVIVTIGQDRQLTVNLAAPLVINLANYLGSQIFQGGSSYSFRHPVSEILQPTLC